MLINLVKRNGVLMPSLPEDELALQSIKQGEIVAVKLTKPRNSAFNRKYFALLQIVVDNTDYSNTDQILHLMKLKLGYFDQIVNTNGKVVCIPKSISFAKMDSEKFNQFYNQSINIILRDFLPKWNNENIDLAVNQIIGF